MTQISKSWAKGQLARMAKAGHKQAMENIDWEDREACLKEFTWENEQPAVRRNWLKIAKAMLNAV